MGRIALAPATRALLVRLEEIEEGGCAALGEEPARDRIRAALVSGFLAGEAYADPEREAPDPPADFALDDPQAEAAVAAAIGDFLRLVAPAYGEPGLADSDQRLEALTDPALTTPGGRGYWSYFPFRG